MVDYLKRSWAVVDLDNIDYNSAAIRKTLTPRCKLMGVVKADAYGHGAKHVADELARSGADWFGVSNIDEAVSLRKAGISHPILIFGPTPPEHAERLNEYRLTQSVHSARYGSKLHNAAESAGVKLDIHIKADTGMSRLGFDSVTGVSEILEIASYPNFHTRGIFTHFSCADDTSGDAAAYTRLQFERFKSLISSLENRGLSFELKHCCNSAATILYPEMHMDMVRPGIAIYGLSPSPGLAGKLELRPAMELYSTVSMVKEIEAETPVSYGRIYTAKGKTKVATVPIGYADGFGRELSGKARMLVRGKSANVIGRVCMDQLMLDVTHIEDVEDGDIVTVIGEGSMSFDEMAELSGTINYEKVCLVSRRVPRVYRKGGKETGVADYVGDIFI